MSHSAQNARSKAQANSEPHLGLAEVAVHGSPVEIVEHIARLGDLYGSIGVDRDGTQSLIGEQLEDAALEATEDLLKAPGTTAADAAAFAFTARLNFVAAIGKSRRLQDAKTKKLSRCSWSWLTGS